jgi:hypothetical protein
MEFHVATGLAPAEEPTRLTGYFGPVPAGEIRAPDYRACERQAFLVRMRPERPVLRVHYHPVDQFQVFCWGAAEFAGHRVASGTVHYADRFSPYGPLQPVDRGVSFLTLRSESSSGAHYMPESRRDLAGALSSDERPADRRRNISFDLVATADGTEWTDSRVDVDGLRVASVRLGPRETSADIDVGGDGAFIVVLDGAITAPSTTDDDRRLAITGIGGTAWAECGTKVAVTAPAETGAVVACLQLPERPVSVQKAMVDL